MEKKQVTWYFDFISPYSYIASQHIERDPELRGLPLHAAPIVFGTILAHRGVKGPGEIPRQRELGLMDNLLLCDRFGYTFKAPPRHPFNPLYALRSVVAVEDPVKRLELALAYFRLGWKDGLSLEDLAVLRRGLAEVGVTQDPEEAASEGKNRKAVKELTQQAIDAGVTGVPSFLVDGDVVFFGQDRIGLLKSYLAGEVTLDRERLRDLLSRQGSTRVV